MAQQMWQLADEEVCKFDTVGELKDTLREESGSEQIPELFFNGNHLKNENTTLHGYGIRRNSTVDAYVGNSKLLSLTIKIPSRKRTFSIEVKPEDTVQHVKGVIEDKEKMGSDEYNLVYRGRVLEEEKKTLAFLGITKASSLYVVLNPRVLQVSVRMVGGKTVEIEVREFYTILDVRSLVESIVGYSVEVLSYGGMKLVDSKTVSYYEIKDKSILEVFQPTTPTSSFSGSFYSFSTVV